jgi:DNA-binding NarL/FixJ family response regulator
MAPPKPAQQFRCGAHGVIFRDEPLETLSECIHAVHQGQVWANSKHLGYLLEALGQTKSIRLPDARGAELLSKREETRCAPGGGRLDE